MLKPLMTYDFIAVGCATEKNIENGQTFNNFTKS